MLRPVAAPRTIAFAFATASLLVLWATAPALSQPDGTTPSITASATVRPVLGAVVRPFVAPTHPYGPGHRGVDLSASEGQAVHAPMDGTVVFSGIVAHVGWVTLDHGGGLVTTYGPLAVRPPPGTHLLAGQVIGELADAEHLDWGARLDGEYLDPMLLLRRWGGRLTRMDAVPTGSPTVIA